MRRTLPPSAIVVLLLGACAQRATPAAPSSAPPAVASAPAATGGAKPSAPETLAIETALSTPAGATFTVAAGWSFVRRDDGLVLTPPEADLRVAVLDARGTDPKPLVEAAWKSIAPDFARPLKTTTSPPPRDGWDQTVQFDYDVPAVEQRAAIAMAYRRADRWHLVLIEGAIAGLDRRMAQTMNVVRSLRPIDGREEDLSGRTAKLDPQRIESFLAFVEEARLAAKVPGAAVVIVSGGKIAAEKGFGVRTAGSPAVVTPKTLFMIGSTTKSLSTLLLAAAVDAGKLRWDQPAKEILPQFALGDPATTEKVLVRHTVCACTGLPRQDMEFVFEWAAATPESRLSTLAGMKPTTGFGETYQYSNLLVAAGGYLAGRAFDPKAPLASAFDRALRTKILDPLGMTATTLDPKVAAKAEHADPHALDLAGETRQIALALEGGVQSVGPAGAAWSTVRDLARVIQLELGKGRTPEGKQIVSEANLLARRAPQVKIVDDLHYGLGLYVEKDHGVAIVHHGGNTFGFTSDLFVLPDHDLGVALLANVAQANAFRAAVRRRFLEVVFDGRDLAAKNLAFGLERRSKALADQRAKLVEPAPAEFVEAVVGAWTHPSLGRVVVGRKGTGLLVDAGEWKARAVVERQPDGAHVLVLSDPPFAGLEFAIDGGAVVLHAGQQTYAFSRAKP
jgi:CubicO group peptidase (beta-lactamase class C family)